MTTDVLPKTKLRRRKPGEAIVTKPEVNWEAEKDEFGRGYFRCEDMKEKSGEINSDNKIKPTGKHDANLLGSKVSDVAKKKKSVVNSISRIFTDDDIDDVFSLDDEEKDSYHYPVIDIDLPCQWVPSSNEGHGHLYINVPMGWANYQKLLTVMSEVGLVEKGFVDAAIKRGQTYVRPAWVKKEQSEMPSRGYI